MKRKQRAKGLEATSNTRKSVTSGIKKKPRSRFKKRDAAKLFLTDFENKILFFVFDILPHTQPKIFPNNYSVHKKVKRELLRNKHHNRASKKISLFKFCS